MAGYDEPYPGAKEKIIRVLKIMLTAWVATTLINKVDEMVAEL